MKNYEALLQQNPNEEPYTTDQVIAALRELKQFADEQLQPVVDSLQQLLDQLSGHQFNDLTENKRVAAAIQELLAYLNRRILCPRPACNKESSLVCNAAGGAKHGTFGLRHQRGKTRTVHTASTVLPQLTLTSITSSGRRRKFSLS